MGQPWCHIGPPERLGPPGESPPQEISSLEGTGSGGGGRNDWSPSSDLCREGCSAWFPLWEVYPKAELYSFCKIKNENLSRPCHAGPCSQLPSLPCTGSKSVT